MTGLLPCTCAGTCQADRTCQLPSRFQAQLDAPPRAQRPSVHRRTEACAGHFGALAAAVATWARDDDLAEGDLTILAIDPAPRRGPARAAAAPRAGPGPDRQHHPPQRATRLPRPQAHQATPAWCPPARRRPGSGPCHRHAARRPSPGQRMPASRRCAPRHRQPWPGRLTGPVRGTRAGPPGAGKKGPAITATARPSLGRAAPLHRSRPPQLRPLLCPRHRTK